MLSVFGGAQTLINWRAAQEKETGFRYTPTTTFGTFPFPEPTDKQAVSTAARALETFRQGWLKPKTGPQRSLTQLYTENPTWLSQAHDRLDRAVAAAYGWPADITDDEILRRILALNAQRKPVAQNADDDDDVGETEEAPED